MSEAITESANVIIPEAHQSSPKEHWADKEIKKAAEEIDSGRYRPQGDSLDNVNELSIALRSGTAEEVQKPVGLEDFDHTHNTLLLAEHPRVKEAMTRLEKERDESKSHQEFVEKSQMLHEMNERKARGNRWEGQERWQGEENEEMRYGLILTPIEFYKRLIRVIGEGRVFLGQYAVKQRPTDRSARVPLYVRANKKIQVFIPCQETKNDELIGAATLQWPCGTEWMIMRFDEYGVPTTAKYLGWRTALLTLIRGGVITEKEAHQAFPLGSGPAGAWYRQQLKEWRTMRRVN
jgi:hypothetical protein